MGATIFVAVGVLAPLFPQSVEWDPSHAHIVMGGDALERARALAAHRAGLDRHMPPAGVPHTDESYRVDTGNGPVVFSLRSANTAGTVLSIGGSMIATAGALALPAVLPAGRVSSQLWQPPQEIALPVPEPPPRPS